MITFAAGIAVGAVFAPFWIKVYNGGKELYTSFMNKK